MSLEEGVEGVVESLAAIDGVDGGKLLASCCQTKLAWIVVPLSIVACIAAFVALRLACK